MEVLRTFMENAKNCGQDNAKLPRSIHIFDENGNKTASAGKPKVTEAEAVTLSTCLARAGTAIRFHNFQLKIANVNFLFMHSANGVLVGKGNFNWSKKLPCGRERMNKSENVTSKCSNDLDRETNSDGTMVTCVATRVDHATVVVIGVPLEEHSFMEDLEKVSQLLRLIADKV